MKSRQVTVRLRTNNFLWSFSQKCSWNWTRYTSRKIIWCLRLVKKDIFCKEFPQNATDSPESFPEAVVQRFSLKEIFLKISQNLQEIPCSRVFLIKLQSSSSQLYLKKRPQYRRFPMNFANVSRTPPGCCLVFHYFKSDFPLYIFFL